MPQPPFENHPPFGQPPFFDFGNPPFSKIRDFNSPPLKKGGRNYVDDGLCLRTGYE